MSPVRESHPEHRKEYTGQPVIHELDDPIVLTAAYRGERALKYFIEEACPAAADFSLRELHYVLEEAYGGEEMDVHYCPIHTMDSFATKTEEFPKRSFFHTIPEE